MEKVDRHKYIGERLIKNQELIYENDKIKEGVERTYVPRITMLEPLLIFLR